MKTLLIIIITAAVSGFVGFLAAGVCCAAGIAAEEADAEEQRGREKRNHA